MNNIQFTSPETDRKIVVACLKWAAIAYCVFVAIALIVLFIVHKQAQSKWVEQASRELAFQPAPTNGVAQSFFRPGDWAGKGYIMFSNGWAGFRFNTRHESMKIGDVAILRTSEGDLYISHFHFCVGEDEFSDRPQPKDISGFLTIFGQEHDWKQMKPSPIRTN